MLIMSKRNYLLGNNENSGSQKTNHNPPQQDKTLREEIQCLGVQFKESQERMATLLGAFLDDLRRDLGQQSEAYRGKHEGASSEPAKAQEPNQAAPPKKEVKDEGKTYLKVIYYPRLADGTPEWRQPLYNKRVALAVDPNAVSVFCIVDKDGFYVRQAKPDEIKGVYIE